MNQETARGKSFWYAVSTRSRQEKVVAAMLAGQGVRQLLPLITEVRRWSDRKQKVSLPLFPGYLFVNIAKSYEAYLGIVRTPGVINFVGNPSGPIAIPDEEIDSIQTVLSHGVEYFPYAFLTAGDRVRVVGGALAGVEGTYIRRGPDSRLVISIEIIHRSVAINVCGCDIELVRRRSPSHVHAAETVLSAGSRA
jgi:transcription antitermination factor NusG